MKKSIFTFLTLVLVATSFCFANHNVDVHAKTKMTVKVGKKKVKFNSQGGKLGGKLKTKKGYITRLPIAYKKGYKTIGWYSGKTQYFIGRKITKKRLSLKPKYKKLKSSDYTDMVDIDYITSIYINAFYDEYSDVVADNGKVWKNNQALKKYFIKHSIPRGYCPNADFNPKAYMKIVKSKYGIKLSSYTQALDFYLACYGINYDSGTLRCIHEGGKFDDSFVETETDYYQDKYKVYETGEYSMFCDECGKYFYGPTKHDDWVMHMDYICNVLDLPGSGWAPYSDKYYIFYKKEDHEHTDTVRRTYCQNQGKKKSEKLLKQDYKPYTTKTPISYPPTGPVLWYVDKF